VDRLKIILSEQMERTEQLVVFQIKRLGRLEITLEGDNIRWLDNELLGGADLTELLVVLRSRDSGSPPRSAPMVVVRVRIHVGSMVLCVVEVLRHDCEMIIDGSSMEQHQSECRVGGAGGWVVQC